MVKQTLGKDNPKYHQKALRVPIPLTSASSHGTVLRPPTATVHVTTWGVEREREDWLWSSRHGVGLFDILHFFWFPSHWDNAAHFTDEDFEMLNNLPPKTAPVSGLLYQTKVLHTSLVCVAKTLLPYFTLVGRRAVRTQCHSISLHLFHPLLPSHSSCPSRVNEICTMSTVHKW